MSQRTRSPFSPLVGIIMLVLVILGIYFVIKGIFWVLYWVFPVLLIATFIIDRQVLINYVMWIVNAAKNKNWPVFLGGSIMTVIAFPLITAFLFGKAMFKRKVKQVTQDYDQKAQGNYVEYEEIPEEKPEILELPDLTQRREPKKEPIKQQRSQNDYEDLFED